MIKAGQKAVSAGVTAGGIFAHAAIKSAIAYQRTPGRNESPKTKGQLAIADEVEVDEEPEEPRSVRIIRVIDNSVPGSIPPPELVEVGTQTDPIQILSSSGVSSLAGSEFSISRSATPSLESLPESSTVTGIFASYLSSTLQLTSNIAATTSEYVLGKDRTLALRGIDPIEAYKPTEPVDGTVTYLNVGGSLFATTLETLQAAPTTSLLYEFFIDPEKRETLTLRSGAFFVDRDGTHFSHILNYLRGIPTHATITNTQHLRSLLVEAQYYRLDELAVEIDEQVRELELREADLGQLLNKVGQRIAKDKWRWVTAANAVVIIAVTVGLILY
ncbi:BTB/POZ protein [Gaertneriomyces semiglobifer]|nr:BTB/POZ protein [Gaertneriomyces semiglobifer]